MDTIFSALQMKAFSFKGGLQNLVRIILDRLSHLRSINGIKVSEDPTDAAFAEAKSLATLQRLNDSQTLAGIDGIQRIHVGPSVDLLIRMDDDVDVGCGESSKPVKNKETDTKTLTEGGIKGPKTAQDMLAYLKHVTYDQTTTRKLKVMVLITAGNQLALLSHTYYSLKGLTLQLLRMDAPAGYM